MSLRFWQGGGESQTTLSPVMPNIFVGKKNSYMYRSVQKNMLCTLKNFPWLFLVLAPWWPSNGFRLHHHESDAGSRWAHLLRFTEPPALELQTKVRENFTITEKTPTRAFSFSWLKLPASAFTFKTLYLACYTDLVGIIKQEKTLVDDCQQPGGPML